MIGRAPRRMRFTMLGIRYRSCLSKVGWRADSLNSSFEYETRFAPSWAGRLHEFFQASHFGTRRRRKLSITTYAERLICLAVGRHSACPVTCRALSNGIEAASCYYTRRVTIVRTIRRVGDSTAHSLIWRGHATSRWVATRGRLVLLSVRRAQKRQSTKGSQGSHLSKHLPLRSLAQIASRIATSIISALKAPVI